MPISALCGLDEVVEIPDLVRIASLGKPELQTNGETRILGRTPLAATAD
jgi:hypothetical protein